MKRPAALYLVALGARLMMVAWAAPRIPPAADGTFYATFAARLAEGKGYTWAWPDGAVTYASHYPVGYPALVAATYLVFGEHPWLAMLLNAAVGAAAAVAVYALVRRAAGGRERGAVIAGLLVALHPALVPYTAAFMTEGVVAALLAIAPALAVWRPGAVGRTLAGLAMGIATLVRPQSLALAPVVGALSVRRGGAGLGARVAGAVATGAIAVCVCLPWTLRNCERMHRCALVSVNAGWNLLIGEQSETGGWQEIDVPAPCRTVWDEAQKDACFERVARERIAAAPEAWLARAPRKLGVTFDYFGAAPWYLHLAAPESFPETAKVALGTAETVVSRALLLFALASAAMLVGPRRRVRAVVALVGAAAAVSRSGWIGYLALAAALALAWSPRDDEDTGPLVPWTAAVIAATALTHAVFFGAGRYGLVVVPLVAAVAALRTPMPPSASASLPSSSSSD